jgi:CRISPR-associated protein Csm4
MKSYTLYTLKIKPVSPFLTPLESDTIFGHICWAMEYLGGFNGSKNLSAFLEEFDNQNPPLIMSNAFPGTNLPFPLLPPFSDQEKEALEKKFLDKYPAADRFDFIQWLKVLARQPYIALDVFNRFQGNFSKYDLYMAILEEGETITVTPAYTGDRTVEIYHNAINRLTGKVIEGQLFSTEATFYPADVILQVYLKTWYFTDEELKEIFGFIGRNGYGADKSTGSGRFEFELAEGVPFVDIEGCNAYLLLSNTHPVVLQGHTAYYTTLTKFGKLGGVYSTTAKYSPYKNPVLLLKPGSVVLSSQPVEFFGENFSGVHPQLEQVRHYGIGYPVKMRLKNEV